MLKVLVTLFIFNISFVFAYHSIGVKELQLSKLIFQRIEQKKIYCSPKNVQKFCLNRNECTKALSVAFIQADLAKRKLTEMTKKNGPKIKAISKYKNKIVKRFQKFKNDLSICF